MVTKTSKEITTKSKYSSFKLYRNKLLINLERKVKKV